jgi:glycosyltransferase involved in cell wall biosynthesis
VQEKGVYDLLHATALAAAKDHRITCVLVGAKPSFDQTNVIRQKVESTPTLKLRVKILPACSPAQVWEYLCAADIFAFPSHAEGMPNALLEAMAMAVPAVTFAIPAVQEIKAGTEALVVVPPFDSLALSYALLHLASSPETRARIGERGREQVMNRFLVRNNMRTAVQLLSQMIKTRRTLSDKIPLSAIPGGL